MTTGENINNIALPLSSPTNDENTPTNEENTPTNEEDNTYISNSNTFIDKITMECMMNKKHYNTYLSKTNPNKLKESKELQNKIIEYGPIIENIIYKLLDNSNKNIRGKSTLYNIDIQRSFDVFIQYIIKYIDSNKNNDIEETNEDFSTKFIRKYSIKQQNDIYQDIEENDEDQIIIQEIQRDYEELDLTNQNKKRIKKQRPEFFTPKPRNL